MTLHEAQARLGQGDRVQRAASRSRVRLLDLRHGEPVRVGCLLLLESPLKGVHEVPDPEGADGVPADGVPWCGENGVNEPRGLATVVALNDLAGGLCNSNLFNFFLNWAIPDVFFLCFCAVECKYLKLDLICGSLVLEATALSTEQQPLPCTSV